MVGRPHDPSPSELMCLLGAERLTTVGLHRAAHSNKARPKGDYMAQPVWVLSVDLQAKTAVFQSGLADAAKAARGSFKDISQGAKEAGGETGYSMMEARHSVMMLGEEFGLRMPRALSGFIAGLGPVGPALEAAFPFLAIIGLAALFIEHLNKLH